MVKAKKGKNKKAAAPVGPTTNSTSSTTTPSMTATAVTTTTATATATSPDHPMMETTATVTAASSSLMTTSHPVTASSSRAAAATITAEDLDDLTWLRDIEMRQASNGEPLLKLEYNDNDDECMSLLQRFLEESSADSEIIDAIYQIWQQTVLSTLLQSSATWKKETVTQRDQKTMKDSLRVARLKINFILHHLIGRILTSPLKKWVAIRDRVMDMCYNTLQLMPRLVESCQHHPTDIRLAIVHYEGKEFLAAVACETWDTLYDYSIRMDPQRFVPVLRRCAMLDILDKDWNMLGGWDDVLKGLEMKCCQHLTNNHHNGSNHHHHHYNNNNNITTSNSNSSSYPSTPYTIPRLPSDYILHETTTILRNARNSMQCKFFSVRFMRYTDDQAPQRYRYYPKCSAPACANIETSHQIHPYRCTKCWYFHYCSASCQEYCDNIMGLHAKFCNDTPKAKAAACQKETEQYLGWSLSSISSSSSRTNPNDLHDLTVVRCHTCGVPDDHHGTTTTTTTTTSTWHTTVKMKRCVQCQRVSYCSRACQEWDWRVGGHCHVCRPITTTTTVTNNNTLLLNNNNNKSSGSGTNNHTTTTTTTTSMAKDLN